MKTLDFSSLLPLGFISKTHGFNGELLLAITTELFLDPPDLASSFLFIELNGLPVPFFIENVREKSGSVIVKLDTINDEAEAKKYIGKNIMLLKDAFGENTAGDASWDDLIGYAVHDSTYGELGPLLEIQEMPMQFLALCRVNEKEILFPLHDEFILEIDDSKKILHIDLPEGLLDVYLDNESE